MIIKQKYIFALFFATIGLCSYTQIIKQNKSSSIINKSYPFLKPEDFTVKQFLEVLIKRYNSTSQINSVTFSGDFPENWVKDSDVKYLLSIINSKKKCCGYMNAFSSHISNDNAEVGGFAIIFLKSYISKKQINIGLNSNPKTNTKEAEEIILLLEKRK